MVQIEDSWKTILQQEFDKPYFIAIKQFILDEKAKGKVVYPPGALIFNAFNLTSFFNTKVIIIGQDPYHGSGQANGLSFSVPMGIRQPPSLQNIFKELKQDIGVEKPTHGNLESWAKQGVLLLNAVLTVNDGEPASHKAAGWENFTNAVIEQLSKNKEHLVFILWGKFAQEKEIFIDGNKHLILKGIHPSPMAANRGFFGCKHFSKTNNYLIENGIKPISWNI